MTTGISLIDVMSDALYLTPGSKYSSGVVINDSSDEATKGDIAGNQWYVTYNTVSQSYNLTASYSMEIDLTGLEHQVIAPMGMQSYQAEATGTFCKESGYVRDFTWVTTCPMDLDTLHSQASQFSPKAPYQRFASGGGTDIAPQIAKEQLFTGRAMLWVRDSSVNSLLGFMRNIWNLSLIHI